MKDLIKKQQEGLETFSMIIPNGTLKDCKVYHETVNEYLKESQTKLIQVVIKEVKKLMPLACLINSKKDNIHAGEKVMALDIINKLKELIK